MDVGSTGFIMICTALVFLMTPGLAFFYGGLVDTKHVVGVKLQSFISLGLTTLLWISVGYSLCFSGDIGGIIGNLDHIFLRGISPHDVLPETGLPTFVFIAYQMMFAIITPALITGAFTHRVTFKAYLIFLVLWQLFIYYPFVHMIWGGGLLAQWGVLDFAGGIVVHVSAGMAALATVFYVGPRSNKDIKPHSLPIIALGAALLWFGWFGFNAGSALGVNFVAGLAFLNTQISAAIGALVWILLEWVYLGKPKMLGFLTGSIAGLATITPAAGFISPASAVIVGALAGSVCFYAVQYKNKKGWDDALDVWGVHGVGGALGTVLLGVFGSTAMNQAGTNGLLYYANTTFLFKQVIAVLGTGIYAFASTLLLLKIINVFTPVCIKNPQSEGVDEKLHGESAYAYQN